MMEAKAQVVRVAGERAWVRLSERAGGCGRCDEPGGCRSTAVAYAFKAPAEVFSVPNRIAAQVGEDVLIRVEDGVPLRGALASYGLGVCLLLVGAGLGHALAPAEAADPYALAGALGGLAVAALANRLLARSGAWRTRMELDMVRAGEACSHRVGTR